MIHLKIIFKNPIIIIMLYIKTLYYSMLTFSNHRKIMTDNISIASTTSWAARRTTNTRTTSRPFPAVLMPSAFSLPLWRAHSRWRQRPCQPTCQPPAQGSGPIWVAISRRVCYRVRETRQARSRAHSPTIVAEVCPRWGCGSLCQNGGYAV